MAPWASGTRYSLPRHTHLCGSGRHPCAARKRGEARLQDEEEGVGGASASEPPRSRRPLALPPPLRGGGAACQCRPPLGLAEGLEWREKAVEDRDD